MEFIALRPVERWGLVRRSVALLLAFSFAFGAVLVPEAWATRYVDPTTGSDAANDCSNAASPCATITHALTQVTPPEDVQCAAGTYNSAGGETFPLAMVDQVQIVGAGAGTSIISAPAGSMIFQNNDTPLQSTTRLSGFTLQHDASGSGENYLDFAVGSATMAPQIDNNQFVGSALDDDVGIYAYDDTTDPGTFTGLIDNNVFTDMWAPIWTYMDQGGGDTFSPVISNNTFTDCDYPISFTMSSSAEGTVSPQVNDNTSTGTDDNDLYLYYDPDYSPGMLFSPTITGNTFGSSTSPTAGSNVYIDIDFSSATGIMTFSPTFTGNTMTATGDNIYVAYLDLYSNTGDFTFSPTFSNNTLTSVDGDNFYATTMTATYHDGNIAITPTFSNNTMTAANGSNIYFYSFDVTSMTGNFNFDPVVTDNPQMDAADYNFTIYYGYYYYIDGNASVSPTISGNTMSGASSTAVSIYYTTLSVSSSTQVNTFSPTITNNTINANSGDGVYVYLSDLSYGVFESDLTITGNTFTGVDDGIYLSLEYFSDGTGFDANWLIANNTITSPSGNGIYLELSTMSLSASTGAWNLTISGNTVTDAGDDGMELQPAYSWYSDAQLDQTILIQGNTITGSAVDGIYLYMSDQSGLLSNDVQITDNVIQNSGEDGLDMASTDWLDSPNFTGNAILVSCNTITGNSGDGVEHGGTATWYDPPADFGGGNLGSPGNNTILNNGGYDFYNGDDDDVSAENNWWGTTTTATIDANIYDSNDDGTRGTVDYDPYLSAAASPTVTGSLVGSVAVDVPPAGPSIGDTLLFTLSVDSSGTCGDAVLDFACPVPANTTVVGGSVTTTQGAVASEDPVGVILGHVAAGGAATITWQVVVDSGTQVTTQGTVTGTLVGAVLTDDPAQPGASDPTVIVLLAAAAGSVQFDSATYSVLENAGSVTLTVNRSGGIDGAVSVDFTTVDGTAVDGTDYTLTSGTLNWADQDGAPKTIVVPILDNAAADGSRAFTVELSNAQGGVVIALPDTATVTIADDESIGAAIPTVGEWGMMLLIGLLLLAGLAVLRRRDAPAALLLAALLVTLVGSAAGPDRDLEKQERKNTSVATVESVEVDGDLVTLRLDDGSVLTAREKDFRFRDARHKQWRTERVSKEERLALRDSHQVQAKRVTAKVTKRHAKAAGDDTIRRKDAKRQSTISLKSLPTGQPVLVTVERDRDGNIGRVGVQAVASVESAQLLVDARRQHKLERATERAVEQH